MASRSFGPFDASDFVATIAEAHGLYRKRCQTVLDGLQREVVFVARLAAAITPVFVDTHDIVNAIAMARDGDDDWVWRLPVGGSQQIANHRDARTALQEDAFAAIVLELANFESLWLQRCPRRKAAQ